MAAFFSIFALPIGIGIGLGATADWAPRLRFAIAAILILSAALEAAAILLLFFGPKTADGSSALEEYLGSEGTLLLFLGVPCIIAAVVAYFVGRLLGAILRLVFNRPKQNQRTRL
ncbi:MAG: hypothetical protein ACRCS0_15200 [Albidovulum sp.]